MAHVESATQDNRFTAGIAQFVSGLSYDSVPEAVGPENVAAQWRQAVVTAALAVLVGSAPLAGVGDEPVCEQALDHAIQIPGIEREQAAGTFGDRLHDAVSVALLLGQGQEQLEIDRLQREMCAGIGGHIVILTIRRILAYVPRPAFAAGRHQAREFERESTERHRSPGARMYCRIT